MLRYPQSFAATRFLARCHSFDEDFLTGGTGDCPRAVFDYDSP